MRTSRFVVVYSTAQHAEVWAVIEGVPTDVTRQQVAEQLEIWPKWPSWRARMAIGGQLDVRPYSALRRSQKLLDAADGLDSATVLHWDELAPAERVISTPVRGELYAKVARRALIKGVTLREFVQDSLERAVR